MWERTSSLGPTGKWEPVPDSSVPPSVLRRYNRYVKQGRRSKLYVPSKTYYYRYTYCV